MAVTEEDKIEIRFIIAEMLNEVFSAVKLGADQKTTLNNIKFTVGENLLNSGFEREAIHKEMESPKFD